LIFKGDLGKLPPANLLLFLAQLGKEGLLTGTNGDEILGISLKGGFLVDAQSDRGDEKILRALFYSKLISREQLNSIAKIRKNAGIPLVRVLEELKLFPLSNIRKILENGIREVLFQFFLWEGGQFHFADVAMESEAHHQLLDCQRIALEIARYVDEWHEIHRSLTSLDRIAAPGPAARQTSDVGYLELMILKLANGRNTIRQIVLQAPYPSYQVLGAIAKLASGKWLVLPRPGLQPAPAAEPAEKVPPRERLFFDFKRSLKKIILSEAIQPKIAELIAFCKDHFEQTLVLTAIDHTLVRCTGFLKDSFGQLHRKEIRDIAFPMNDEPVFSWVYRSGNPFFGKVFSSNLLEHITQLPPTGECAVILLKREGSSGIYIFAFSAREMPHSSPFHYLELISWMINPPREMSPTAISARSPEPAQPQPSYSQSQAGPVHLSPPDRHTAPQDSHGPQTPFVSNGTVEAAPLTSHDQAALLVDSIEELPSMPHVVTQILQLLSDQDTPMTALTHVLAQDQSLVARLIKVSNSALYGGNRKISTLSHAITRLGTKMIRSLVLAAFTHSLFSDRNAPIGIYGQSLWQHSKECAMASRRVADLAHYSDPEEAFVGGLLHDIGKLAILIKLPQKYSLIRKKQLSAKTVSTEVENEVLGCDHTKIGELLMRKWEMPESLQACVRYHHRPQDSVKYGSLSTIIACGNHLSHMHGFQAEEARPDKSTDIETFETILHLSPAETESLYDTITSDFQLTDIFD